MGLIFFSLIPKSFEKVILIYPSKQILWTGVSVEITNKDTFWNRTVETRALCVISRVYLFLYCSAAFNISLLFSIFA